jgi:hypothetical protein
MYRSSGELVHDVLHQAVVLLPAQKLRYRRSSGIEAQVQKLRYRSSGTEAQVQKLRYRSSGAKYGFN